MVEIIGDIWANYRRNRRVILVPVCCSLKKNKHLIMNKGFAAKAKHKIDGLDIEMGAMATTYGFKTQWVTDFTMMFPVKDKWDAPYAHLPTAVRSIMELAGIAVGNPSYSFYIPSGFETEPNLWRAILVSMQGRLGDNVALVSKLPRVEAQP
jgi:hypothetical protein